ncbi:hypothetical protein RhiirA1_459070 [Rhizophagus irregularis]|uniref:Uncharacterized protein n=1 Tax=Rhizophagus irregularis TaxID=588596 RepID=A0A2N0RUB9_9GLOM|nr:hypothetical protein RhiirA1_459070 [Rhizophagus irregularis]
MNERGQEFKNWGEVAEILSLETDNKVLYEETGNEQICTKLLVNGLKDFDLTISDLDQLLLMYDESISEFHNKKTTLKNLPYAQSRVGPDNLSKPKNVTTKKTSLKKFFVDKPLKELERQDETEKRNSKEEFADNELKDIQL